MSGRPKWKPTKEDLKAIYELAKQGCTDEEIGKAIGICKDTFIKHKSTFFDELKKGRDEGLPINIASVENALLRKCRGFEYEEITEEPVWLVKDGYPAIHEDKQMRITKRVRKFVPPSDSAIFYYLGNRAPDKWKSVNYTKHEHELGPDELKEFAKIADAIESVDTRTD